MTAVHYRGLYLVNACHDTGLRHVLYYKYGKMYMSFFVRQSHSFKAHVCFKVIA
jgi:hypothetical protein